MQTKNQIFEPHLKYLGKKNIKKLMNNSDYEIISRTLNQVYSSDWDSGLKNLIQDKTKSECSDSASNDPKISDSNEQQKSVDSKVNQQEKNENKAKSIGLVQPWSDNEDALLLASAIIYGKHFDVLCQLFPYRSKASVKARWKRAASSKYNEFLLLKNNQHQRYEDIINVAKLMLQNSYHMPSSVLSHIETNKKVSEDKNIQQSMSESKEASPQSEKEEKNIGNNQSVEKDSQWEDKAKTITPQASDESLKDVIIRINENKKRIKELKWNINYLESLFVKIKEELSGVESSLAQDEEIKSKIKKSISGHKRQRSMEDYNNQTKSKNDENDTSSSKDEINKNKRRKTQAVEVPSEIIEITDDPTPEPPIETKYPIIQSKIGEQVKHWLGLFCSEADAVNIAQYNSKVVPILDQSIASKFKFFTEILPPQLN